jgi:tRNA threonylcarbamoyladenosine biosynthesis protein TsaE
MTSSAVCASPDATEAFGAHLGRRLKGGETIELISDLGGGKTTLTRGIAQGAGSRDVVGSPTFMLSKLYKARKCDIYHFDFYRLTEAGLMEHELHDALEDPHAIVIVEWGAVVQHVLPGKRLTIHINKTADDSRKLICTYPAGLTYLVGQP